MALAILLFLLGLVLLYFGAEWLVAGASSAALRFGIAPLVVGLTVVAFGTSAPELLVSLLALADGKDGISVGNIIVPNSEWKKHPDWPKWTRGLPNSDIQKIEKGLKSLDWSDLEYEYGPSGGSWTTSKRKRTAKEVKRRLRATKRRGKRRTRRQLLQDVLD